MKKYPCFVVFLFLFCFSSLAFGQVVADTTRTASFTAANQFRTITTEGRHSVGLVLSGTWSATIRADLSSDNGQTWETSVDIYDVSAKTFSTSVTANGTYTIGSVGGMSTARLFVSSYTSGTILVALRASVGAAVSGAITPGVGATDLGKARDSVAGSTDTGVAFLAIHNSNVAHLTTAEGDYDVPRLSDYGALQTEPEQHHIFNPLDATTGWTVLGDDTLNLAATTKHTSGTAALSFDKDDGGDDTIFAGIQNTISSVDLADVSPHDIIQTVSYIPSLTTVDYVFVRVGTDSSNYNEWRISDDDLTAAIFEILLFNIGDANHDGITGNGWDPTAITYIVVGVAFDAETDTLAGIIYDELSFHTNQHTSASIQSEVTSSVNSSNVNVQKVGNKIVNTDTGNSATGTQRVVLASDQPAVEVGGGAADGATVAGNPVLIGGSDGTNAQTILTNASGAVVMAVVNDAGTTSILRSFEADSDAMVSSTRLSGFHSPLFNGTTWDRPRNNEEVTLLASAARTAQTDSSDQVNYNAKGVMIILDITVDGASVGLTPSILMKDPISGKDVTIWTAAAAATLVGTDIYLIYPGVLAADFDGTEAVSIALPRTWVLRIAVADADSATYSVGASYIN